MAAGTKLLLKFGTASGEKTFSYNYGNASATGTVVKRAMQTMIDNGEIYTTPPLTMISAKFQIVTETEVDLDEE